MPNLKMVSLCHLNIDESEVWMLQPNKKLYASVEMPSVLSGILANAHLPCQSSLSYDKGDNEVKPGSVKRSPGICLVDD